MNFLSRVIKKARKVTNGVHAYSKLMSAVTGQYAPYHIKSSENFKLGDYGKLGPEMLLFTVYGNISDIGIAQGGEDPRKLERILGNSTSGPAQEGGLGQPQIHVCKNKQATPLQDDSPAL